MSHKIGTTTTLFFALALACTAWAEPLFIGYYPDWGKWHKPAYTVDKVPYEKLTHVLWSFITPNTDGSLKGDAADLGKRIDQYIAAQKDNNVYKQEDGLKQVWRTYTELLGVQNYNRTAEYTTKNPVTGNDSPVLTRLVPEKIADDFFELYKNNVVGNDPRYLKFNDEGEYHYYA